MTIKMDDPDIPAAEADSILERWTSTLAGVPLEPPHPKMVTFISVSPWKTG